jgi:hypothetical protein
MNVTPTSRKRVARSTWLWLAAGAAFVLAIVGVGAERYVEWAYGHSQGALLIAAAVVKWAGSVAAIVLTIAGAVSTIAAAVRRLIVKSR